MAARGGRAAGGNQRGLHHGGDGGLVAGDGRGGRGESGWWGHDYDGAGGCGGKTRYYQPTNSRGYSRHGTSRRKPPRNQGSASCRSRCGTIKRGQGPLNSTLVNPPVAQASSLCGQWASSPLNSKNTKVVLTRLFVQTGTAPEGLPNPLNKFFEEAFLGFRLGFFA